MTIEEKIFALLDEPRWAWAATWFRLGEVIVQTPEKSWATKTPTEDECPHALLALGCTGVGQRGAGNERDWIGWDLDVGHGKKSYQVTYVAIQAARLIKARMGPWTEIRLSKSGRGVHVRTLLKNPVQLDEGPKIAKAVIDELGIRADPTALSRQAFWLCCAEPGENAFKCIEAATFS